MNDVQRKYVHSMLDEGISYMDLALKCLYQMRDMVPWTASEIDAISENLGKAYGRAQSTRRVFDPEGTRREE